SDLKQEPVKLPQTKQTEQKLPDGSSTQLPETGGTGTTNNTNLQQDPNPQQLNIPPYKPMPVPPIPSLVRLGVTSGTTLSLSLQDAVRLALVNNNNIEVARDDVRFAEANLKAAQGVYDPVLNLRPEYSNDVQPLVNVLSGTGQTGTFQNSSINNNADVTQLVPFHGGQYQLIFNNSRSTSTSTNTTFNPLFDNTIGISYTQPLLRNFFLDTNQRDIRVQKKVLAQTDADFRLQTIEVINNVEQAYWELVFALRDQENDVENLNLARERFKQTEARIAAGAGAPLERAQVQTEVSTRESDLLLSTQNLSVAENNLKQLILKNALAPEWSTQIMPTDHPTYSDTPVNLDDVLKEARANRPELSRLRLQQDINKIDLDFFRDQTRPQIDLRASYISRGIAGSSIAATDPFTGQLVAPGAQVPLIDGDPTLNSTAFLLSEINSLRAAQGLGVATVPLITPQVNVATPGLVGGFGSSLGNLFNLNTRQIIFGLTIQIPLRNRTAQANYAGAKIQKDQNEARIRAQEETVEVDVRSAAQAVET
ncbi:MAG: TolC family protein, partial [Pyrinomonadaceae bacterium]